MSAPQGYTSISQFCSKGNELEEGRELLIELTLRKSIPATLVSWDKDADEKDPRNFGYYQKSKVNAIVEGTFTPLSYPFSMTYIKLREEDKK